MCKCKSYQIATKLLLVGQHETELKCKPLGKRFLYNIIFFRHLGIYHVNCPSKPHRPWHEKTVNIMRMCFFPVSAGCRPTMKLKQCYYLTFLMTTHEWHSNVCSDEYNRYDRRNISTNYVVNLHLVSFSNAEVIFIIEDYFRGSVLWW
jgi:hypothetical protein